MGFKTGSIFTANEGAKLINSNILEIIDEQVFSAGLDPVADALGFTAENLEIRDGVYTSMLGVAGLEEIGEFDELPIINKEQGYEKGYKVKRFGWAVAISKELRKWIDASSTSPKLDSTVKRELSKLKSDVTDLINSVKITKNELVSEVLTKGFSVTAAYGAGSASPDGVALFSASHVIKSTGATQSNLVSGALSQVKLKEAIELLRNMKDGKGRKMKRAKTYQLIVPTELEATARGILNDGSMVAAYVNDVQANNDVVSSIFQWDGFRIELLVLETLNQPKADGSMVGSATVWFLLNREAARALKAFKYLNLYSEEIGMYEDPKTKVTFVDVDLSFTADAFNYECIVGSTGA